MDFAEGFGGGFQLKALLAALVALVALVLPLGAFAQSHGGRVIETRTAKYELVANKNMVVIYVDLHGKKKYTVKGAAASFQILNANGQVIDGSKLLAGEGSTLQARGPFKLGPGTKLVASVKFTGQPTDQLSWSFR